MQTIEGAKSVVVVSNLEDLLHAQPLSDVAVLVLKTPPQPRGDMLVVLGRMNVEYPAMQKIALMEGPPPLPVATFLTACGVEMIWAGSETEGFETPGGIPCTRN